MDNKEESIEFEIEDIEDVRIIIKAKGKHFSIIPNDNICSRDEAKEIRITTTAILLKFHLIVSKPLEDISLSKNNSNDAN